jgi:hypothetical protein
MSEKQPSANSFNEAEVPNAALQVSEAISSIEKKEVVDLFNVVLLGQLIKLVREKNIVKINKLIDQYKENASPAVIKKLKEDIQTIVENQEEVITQKEKPKNNQLKKEKPSVTLEAAGIHTGSVFYNEHGDPILVKQANTKDNSINIVNGWGDFLNGCKISAVDSNHITLKYGRDQLTYSLSEPAYVENTGLDLAVGKEKIALDVGQQFLDGKNKQWTISKLLEYNDSVVVEVDGVNGEHQRVHLRDWEKRNNQEILRTLGDQMVLLRNIPSNHEENIPENIAVLVDPTTESPIQQEGPRGFEMPQWKEDEEESSFGWDKFKQTDEEQPKRKVRVINHKKDWALGGRNIGGIPQSEFGKSMAQSLREGYEQEIQNLEEKITETPKSSVETSEKPILTPEQARLERYQKILDRINRVLK